jgi:serine/threonine protein kinase
MRETELIAGRYRIERQAGAGGMGTVYQAFDTRTRSRVALKTWRAEADQSNPRSRVWREARALAEIRHSAVVRYVDHGISDPHGPFLVMDWVEGETLADRLRSEGVLPRQALQLMARLASGLVAMHQCEVIHRDLKPSNIMLPAGDPARATIVDLGVARLVDTSLHSASGGQIGTPRYMAPEQIRNARTVDGRADVFALGCVLFECLTGRVTFEGSDPVSVLSRILFEPLPVPSAVRGDLPSALDALVAALLERDPSRRPTAATALELLAAHAAAVGEDTLARLPAKSRAPQPLREPTPVASTSAADASENEVLRPSFEIGSNAVATAARRALPLQ